jgi:hypothetical protein
MDIAKAFTFVFDDDQWVTKLLIAAAILLLGVLLGIFVIPAILAGMLLAGYGVEITRRVINGTAPVLPEWDNWGELLMDGLKVWIIGLVYALPIIVLGLCLGAPIGILAEESQEASSLLGSCLGCLNFLWSIVVSLLMPAAIAFYVVDGELSAAFRFGDVFNFVRDNFATYLIVLVLTWVAGFVGGLGVLICGVGWLVTAPYASMVVSYLYGQAYLEAGGQTAQPVLEEEFA